LVEVLRLNLASPEAVDEVAVVDLEQLLAELVHEGTTAWPHIPLPAHVFVARLATLFTDTSLAAWLRQLRASDLFLAIACTERVANAIETFDRELLASVPQILSRGGFRDLQSDEIRQRVRERLFVGASRIADYSGRGTLASWLHVVTLRVAIDFTREQRAQPIIDNVQIEDAEFVGTDPELSLIKERYRGPFKRALQTAVGELSSEQRNLLKLHFVDGVTLDKLATLFGVHRATIARRIAQAREAAFDRIRDLLRAELGIGSREFQELLVLLRSRLELSLSALLPSVA
jgi:RNA polymerase sigma-70 factor (ECF subfamily)